MTVCAVPGCDIHYGCRMKAKGLQVSPRVGASTGTRNFTPSIDPPAPAHYRTVLTEDRPGGFKMPILNSDATVIRHRQAQREKHEIADRLARSRALVAAQTRK